MKEGMNMERDFREVDDKSKDMYVIELDYGLMVKY
jgi:hypothetical protein